MAEDWARWSGEYHLMTGGRSLISQRVNVLYEIGVALLAREAEKGEPLRDAADATLNNLDPPEWIEQTRRADGMLEYDPDMEVPGWGYSDPSEMDLGVPPASAGSGSVDGFDPR